MPRPSFDEYMRAYAADHAHPMNRLTHLVGIPLIVASLPVMPVAPPVGLGMFAAGWALQFAGHYFEGKKPSFTRDPLYLAIGPVWITVEWIEVVTGKRIYAPPPAGSGNDASQRGVPAAASA